MGGGGVMSCVLILLADLTPAATRANYMVSNRKTRYFLDIREFQSLSYRANGYSGVDHAIRGASLCYTMCMTGGLVCSVTLVAYGGSG